MDISKDYLIKGIIFQKRNAVQCGSDWEDDPKNKIFLQFTRPCTLEEFKEMVAGMSFESAHNDPPPHSQDNTNKDLP